MATEKIGLHNLSPAPGSQSRPQAPRPRSGLRHGQDVGQGTQGYQGARGPSRPGGGKPQFEGGQMPLTRRLPKRGFTNPFRVEAQVVISTSTSSPKVDGEVTPEALRAAGLDSRRKGPVKLLANGEVSTRGHGARRQGQRRRARRSTRPAARVEE